MLRFNYISIKLAGKKKQAAVDLKKATAGYSLLTTLLPLNSKFFLKGGLEQGSSMASTNKV